MSWLRQSAAIAASIALLLNATGAAAQPAFRPANLKPNISSAEAGIWGASDKAEAAIRSSADLNRDVQLTAYVKGVLCRIAPEYCSEIRVYVLDRPFLNAGAWPNGAVEVNSGLLLRARTEDELSFVLGHEVTHFARNHSLRQHENEKATRNAMLALQIGVTLGAAAAMYSAASTGSPYASSTIDSISRSAQSLNNLIYLAGVASLFAYSRESESEADEFGFKRYHAAGYQAAAAPSIWHYVEDENAASDFDAVRRSQARASIYMTHPITGQRIAALSAMAGTDAKKDPSREEQLRYRAAIRPHLAAWLKDDLRRRDFGQTLFLLDRLSEPGEDLGVINFYRGEAFRLRRKDGDVEKAVAAYRVSVSYADAPPASYRELGEALRKIGDKPSAQEAFRTYLQKVPDAQDRWLIEASLKSLETGGLK